MEWYAQAACRGMPTEWWFPELGMPDRQRRNFYKAKAICADCPVKEQCLKYGKETGSMGLWGGVTLQHGRPSVRNKKRSTT